MDIRNVLFEGRSDTISQTIKKSNTIATKNLEKYYKQKATSSKPKKQQREPPKIDFKQIRE